MSRRHSGFRRSDLIAALKATNVAGLGIVRFEIDRDGKIVIVSGRPTGTPQDLDRELEEFEAPHSQGWAEEHCEILRQMRTAQAGPSGR